MTGITSATCRRPVARGISSPAPRPRPQAWPRSLRWLNTQIGTAQGNLNPILYRMAATAPTAFHDVTVASSGVTSCDIGTPSMCNNSTAGSATSLTGGLAGYLVTTGYDQATGLGSLDVTNFLNAVSAATPTIRVISPTLKTGATAYITASITWTGTPAPTGAVTILVNGSSANVSGMTWRHQGIGNCVAAHQLHCHLQCGGCRGRELHSAGHGSCGQQLPRCHRHRLRDRHTVAVNQSPHNEEGRAFLHGLLASRSVCARLGESESRRNNFP